jgi:ferredoxin-NADP reductase
LILTLKERTLIANDTYEFVFAEDKKLSYKAGQYMEWTFSYDHPDMRGNRRYFTLASSPTEDTLKLGLKFYPNPSGFKSHLLTLPIGEVIVAAQCAGEFIMPHDISKKLVFIAGGIGVTPFRSMIKYCADTGEKRDITMLYSNKTVEDIAYKNIFEEAREKIGIKTLYVVTETKDKTLGQDMYSGSITKEMIQKEIPDYRERAFYISGPHGMVVAFQKTLSEMGISNSQIKTDFFPGFT